jgi:hypothetical protein
MDNCAFSYRYKFDGLHKVSAEIAGKICQELSETEEGLTPQKLVEVSRDESHPLHGEFEWDDAVAAEAYRITQAKQLIRDIVIVKNDAEKRDRGFVITPGRNHVYVPLNNALNNEEWKNNLLNAAKRDMIAFIAKYRRLKELSDVVEPMMNLLDLLDTGS